MRGRKLCALFLAVAVLITGAAPVRVDTVMAAELEAETEFTEGDYTYTVTNGEAVITGYNGTEQEVVTPEELGGCPVTKIDEFVFEKKSMKKLVISEGVIEAGDAVFNGCRNLEELILPKSLQLIGYNGIDRTVSLKNITVAEGNPFFFSVDGILYKRGVLGTTLYCYPANRTDEVFAIPYFANSILSYSFCNTKNLRKLIVPATVDTIHHRMLFATENAIDVYLIQQTMPTISAEAFYLMPSGCRLIVKNQELANQINTNIFYKTEDASVEVLGSSEYPAIPTESLTWYFGKKIAYVRLSPGQNAQAAGQYVQEPKDSTDWITWTSSNSDIAAVNPLSGKIEASGRENFPLQTGECIITGVAESGESISLHVIVYDPVTNVDMSFGGVLNPDGATVNLPTDMDKKYVSIYAYPFSANNREIVEWSSSDESVAVVAADKDNHSSAMLTYKGVGTTTISAVLDDDGTIWTKSFVLTVTKKISSCTIADIPLQEYTGESIKPAITVMDGERELAAGTDYEISYEEINILSRQGIVEITGKGYYTDTVEKTFKIKLQETEKESETEKGSETEKESGTENKTETEKEIETGKEQENGTEAEDSKSGSIRKNQTLKVMSSKVKNRVMTLSHDTKSFRLRTSSKTPVTYKSSNSKVVTVSAAGKITVTGTGYAKLTIKAAKTESYQAASVTIKVYVTPAKGKLTYIKAAGSKALKVKWKRDTNAAGYQLQYSTDKNFTGAKTVTISKNSIVSKKLTGLKSGKKYYVRVRAYKTIRENGRSVKKYGKWSKMAEKKIK